MARVLIRNLHQRTVDRLKKRAAANGRSLQAELQTIVEHAASEDRRDARRIAERIRRKLRGRKFSDSATLVANDRRR